MLARVIEDPEIRTPAHYHRRVTLLALLHPALFLVSTLGVVLLVWRGEFFITLAQRSNVETLTIAFCILFFAYFGLIAMSGAWGAVKVFVYRLRGEAAKQRALGKPANGDAVALDTVVLLEGTDGPWDLEIADSAGSLGVLHFDGVTICHRSAVGGGSNTMFGYIEDKLARMLGRDLAIVEWSSTSDDDFRRYRTTTQGISAIGDKLGIQALPTLTLTLAQRDELRAELTALCPALRDEAFLPDWEFEGEHKLPIIPEPLGIISLSRSEKRVDPLATLTSAFVVITLLVATTCFFLARPPWLPGR
ncbi:MAG TPA: hypothetical protein VGC41_10975 [Kofleriaceae bacterium]